MLQAEYRPVSSITKLEGNPRTIRDKAFQTLCDSLKSNPDFFEARPLILSDRTGSLVVIAGNQRFEAAKHIGMTTVPSVLLPGLTEEREREIVIRDNVNNGEWNMDILANEWSDINLVEWGVPVRADWLNDPLEALGVERLYDEKEITGQLPVAHTCPKCGYAY